MWSPGLVFLHIAESTTTIKRLIALLQRGNTFALFATLSSSSAYILDCKLP
jgi:hypothetical protein